MYIIIAQTLPKKARHTNAEADMRIFCLNMRYIREEPRNSEKNREIPRRTEKNLPCNINRHAAKTAHARSTAAARSTSAASFTT